jgi:hypothetical protein
MAQQTLTIDCYVLAFTLTKGIASIWMNLMRKGRHMKKLIVLIIAGIMLILSCAQNQNLTEEEREKYRRARQRYEWGQRP